jgi:hypothetical protein
VAADAEAAEAAASAASTAAALTSAGASSGQPVDPSEQQQQPEQEQQQQQALADPAAVAAANRAAAPAALQQALEESLIQLQPSFFLQAFKVYTLEQLLLSEVELTGPTVVVSPNNIEAVYIPRAMLPGVTNVNGKAELTVMLDTLPKIWSGEWGMAS